MAKMWAGRTSGEVSSIADDFNSSISFDCKLYTQDITGSMAHAAMLGAQGIITAQEADTLIQGLEGILQDLDSGKLEIDYTCEDIHMFVEQVLTQRLGDVGKKLHTARSRNDQVALDLRMYLRSEVEEISALTKALVEAIVSQAQNNLGVIMPGYTHLQRAQPILFSHHLMAYAMMLLRDLGRLADCRKRMNVSPIGSCALAGTTYNTDRWMEAKALGFDDIARNSIDGVSDRDFCVELLSAISVLMMHLSRFCEEIIIWNTNEYQFVEIDDAYSTGSSIMPQKKNPDIAELVRGKTGRVYGALVSILTTMKGLPLAYNKDMQEDKELTFDAIDTVKGCLALFTGMISTMRFRKDRMEASAKNGFTNATDAADYLVGKGVPFRDAHGIVGRLVLYCLEKDIALDDMTLEEYKAISPVFEEDIYEAISMKNCVEKRNTIGAPGAEAMQRVLEENRRYLEQENF